MPLFFFLFGLFFIESINGKSKLEFISGKFKSIFYPYAVWSILQGCIEVLLSNYTNSKTSLDAVLSFPFHPRAQFWFLYALLLIFILSALIYNKFFTKTLPLILMLSFLAYIFGEDLTSVYYLKYISNNVAFFFLCCLTNKYFATFKGLLNVKFFCGINSGFFVGEYAYFIRLGNDYSNLNIYTAFIAVIAIFWTSNLSFLLSRFNLHWLSVVGKQSIIIFLVHILASSGVRIILTKIFHIENWYFNIIIGTFSGVVLPLIFYNCVSRLNLKFLFVYPLVKKKNHSVT